MPNKTISPSRGGEMTASWTWTAVSWRYPDHNNKNKKWPKGTRKQGADGKINHIKVHMCVFMHLLIYLYAMYSGCTDFLIRAHGICWARIWWHSRSISCIYFFFLYVLLHSFSLSGLRLMDSFCFYANFRLKKCLDNQACSPRNFWAQIITDTVVRVRGIWLLHSHLKTRILKL